jgi:hypothetical protein
VPSDILPTGDHSPKATTFSGDLYRNDLEMDDPPPAKIASGVTANIKNIVHGSRFDANAPTLPQLQYIVFGRGKDIFLAHLITRPPDFDQLIRVTVTPAFSDVDLSRGLTVTVDGRKNTEDERIQPSQQGSVAATVDTGTTSLNVQIDPVAEFYFNDDSDMQ